MRKVPISLIIDDPAPVISVYHEHANSYYTKDGRPIIPAFPNSLLNKFCDIIERHGIKGKFSVVPMPGNKGDIISGLDGVSRESLDEWLDTVKSRVVPNFTVGPEILSHHKAVDLDTGKALSMSEKIWAQSQDRTTLTPYIAYALKLLRQAGFDPIGVTSPWDFGITVEDEYVAGDGSIPSDHITIQGVDRVISYTVCYDATFTRYLLSMDKKTDLFRLTRAAGHQSVGMQHKLLLYWISMLLAVFGAVLLRLGVLLFLRIKIVIHLIHPF